MQVSNERRQVTIYKVTLKVDGNVHDNIPSRKKTCVMILQNGIKYLQFKIKSFKTNRVPFNGDQMEH